MRFKREQTSLAIRGGAKLKQTSKPKFDNDLIDRSKTSVMLLAAC